MFLTSLIFALLIVITPLVLIFDGPIIYGLVLAVAAVLTGIIAVRIRPGEARFLSSVVRPIAIIAAIPAGWMLFQVLPLKIAWLANPIWDSAAATLQQPLSGSISIDPGATLISLARYLSVVAVAFLAAAIALDRRRAAWILFSLLAATTIIALSILAVTLGDFIVLSHRASELASAGAIDSAALGIIFAAAAVLHMLERHKMHGADYGYGGPPVLFRLTVTLCLAAGAICFFAAILHITSQTLFAVICGVAILAIAIIIRRFCLELWGYSAIVSVALVVAIATIAFQPDKRTIDLTLAYAARAPAPLIAVTQRILTETRWTGTGAGTFAAVLPIYRDIDGLATKSVAPTAAAAIVVEMGRPFLWTILIAAIALVVVFLRGAIDRGRDWCYSAAGASCVVIITLLAFDNVGLFSTPVLVFASAAIGIAITQSKSRVI